MLILKSMHLINLHFWTYLKTKAHNLKPDDFARLPQTEKEISSDQSSSPEVLIFEGTIVCEEG